MVEFNFESQVATTIEQSERLIALGLRKETADMCWLNHALTEDYKDWRAIPIFKDWEKWLRGGIPAWSLGRLIEMMPLDVFPEGGFDNTFTLTKGYPSGYSVEYDGFSYYYKKNIYDTIIEGIEHLIKEGYFNKEYLGK